MLRLFILLWSLSLFLSQVAAQSAAPSPAPLDLRVKAIAIVDVDTGKTIEKTGSQAKIDYKTIKTTSLDVRFLVTSDVKSVKYVFNGAATCVNLKKGKISMSGKSPFEAVVIPIGKNTLATTPFAEKGCSGETGATKNFVIKATYGGKFGPCPSVVVGIRYLERPSNEWKVLSGSGSVCLNTNKDNIEIMAVPCKGKSIKKTTLVAKSQISAVKVNDKSFQYLFELPLLKKASVQLTAESYVGKQKTQFGPQTLTNRASC